MPKKKSDSVFVFSRGYRGASMNDLSDICEKKRDSILRCMLLHKLIRNCVRLSL